MSKGLKLFDKVSDGMKVSYNSQPTEDYVRFLNGYDTTNTDNTLANLNSWADRASANLQNMGDYTFNVGGDVLEKQRVEDATYQNYLSKILPLYSSAADDLQTRLINQGIGTDSAAYRNAMSTLLAAQNAALNDAAFNAIEAGENAYTTDLNNQIAAGSFANAAQQSYIDQLLSALTNSHSAYDVATDKYLAQNNLAQNQANAQNQSLGHKLNAIKIGADTATKLINGF
ncbi:MAG: hypothetical protein J5895_00760 [Alphaproteobacteria bacterium]|nr:hypothetical protein [Alphaproteobacteria bacterium]